MNCSTWVTGLVRIWHIAAAVGWLPTKPKPKRKWYPLSRSKKNTAVSLHGWSLGVKFASDWQQNSLICSSTELLYFRLSALLSSWSLSGPALKAKYEHLIELIADNVTFHIYLFHIPGESVDAVALLKNCKSHSFTVEVKLKALYIKMREH